MAWERLRNFIPDGPAHQGLHLAPLPWLIAAVGALVGVQSASAQALLTPDELNEVRSSIPDRIAALTILGGDFGFADGHLDLSSDFLPGVSSYGQLSITKIGGSGDVGDPEPLDGYPIGWQPHLQGNAGYLSLTDEIQSGFLAGQTSRFTDRSVEFGGGARFWVNESLSFAPTLMGVYGEANNEFLPQTGAAAAVLGQLQKLGLIDWRVNVWAVRPALNAQYRVLIDRTIITFSTDFAYFHTQGFNATNGQISVTGNSEFVTNKVDIDIPLGIVVWNHELRTGGYIARTDLMGDLQQGLDVQHLNEIHARITLDFLNQLWKFQWIGIGASRIWGPGISGWTTGVDAAFRF